MVSTTGLISGIARWLYTSITCQQGALPDILALCLLSVAAVMADVIRLKPSATHTVRSLVAQYLSNRMVRLFGTLMKWRMDRACNNCRRTQEDTLKSILKQNAITMFAKDHGIDAMHTVEQFQSTMPLTSYKTYRKYADLIQAEVVKDVLFPDIAYFIAFTSGTTSGNSKAFPKMKTIRQKLASLLVVQMLLESDCGNNLLKKWMYVHVSTKKNKTKSGIDTGSTSGLVANNMTPLPWVIMPRNEITTEHESLYVHWVFGLNEEEISYFSTLVAPTTLAMMVVLETSWESICDDIERGQLSQKLNISATDRAYLNSKLQRNPKRAEHLRGIFRNGFDDAIHKVWPLCPPNAAVRTGTFRAAAVICRKKYFGGVACSTLLHVGTEEFFGVNLDPMAEDVKFIPIVTDTFYEFIPEADLEKSNPRILLAHQVEVGEYYEMVITTYTGLYRYRTEDVVCIDSFYGTTPRYTFIGRSGDILSVDVEKVPEFLVQESVREAANHWTARVIDFTCTESVNVQTISDDVHHWDKHYYAFIELEPGDTLQDDANMQVDKELCERHVVYSAMRRSNKLEPIKLLQVQNGAFQLVKQLMLSINPNSTCMQFKLPRIVRREDVLKLLLKQVIHRH